MFYMQSAGVNFTTATYFHLTLPCFSTLLFLTSSQRKIKPPFLLAVHMEYDKPQHIQA